MDHDAEASGRAKLAPGNRQPTSNKPERSMTGARAQRTSTTAFPALPDSPGWHAVIRGSERKCDKGGPWADGRPDGPRLPCDKARR